MNCEKLKEQEYSAIGRPEPEKTPKGKGERKAGGQKGHPGTTVKPVDKPDKIVPLTIYRQSLLPGEWRSGR
jgi:hypothetical protein